MSRREQIKMSEAEAAAFLGEERTVTCATAGPRGWPHLMPLWYVLRPLSAGEPGPAGGPREAFSGEIGPRVWAWTYAASQKARNLERDPRSTLQVEAGEQYQELRGVMLECDVVVHRELEVVSALGREIFRRYGSPRGESPLESLPADVVAMVAKQASKRIGLEFAERRRATWDHRKLGGVY